MSRNRTAERDHIKMQLIDISAQSVDCEPAAGRMGMGSLPIDPGAILIEAESRYRSFFDNIEQGYYEIDLQGNFIFLNEFVCGILGRTTDELYKSSYRKFMDRENAKLARRIFNDVLETEKPMVGCVFEIIRKDGKKRQVGLSICLMKDPCGRKTGFRGIARDISERKSLEAQQRHAQKLESIGRLAAGIAHEINTPIQYTTDNTRFLQDSFKEIDAVLECFNRLYKTAKAGLSTGAAIHEIETVISETDLEYLREEIPKAIGQSLEGLDNVAKIVSAMKQFSHPGTDEKEYADINRAIQSTITISRNEWKYVADMTTDLDTDLPLIPCLIGEFNQVILNIIINAAHAIGDAADIKSGGKGLIKVTTRRQGPWAEIRISDTGPGIPKEIRDKVFEPFFTTKEVGKGSGQGLAISHSVIVNKHGGSIEFETEINHGTTMIIRLPIGEGNG
ncbi:MAG: PAS domain S-box protein [Deltaproteobacteria bacterium]|nr:PAS domain S-box protein [Deltaproteobacteria bacterium]